MLLHSRIFLASQLVVVVIKQRYELLLSSVMKKREFVSGDSYVPAYLTLTTSVPGVH